MTNDQDQYRKIFEKFDALEQSGALDESAKAPKDKDSIQKFIENPKNRKFMAPELASGLNEEDKMKEKRTEKRKKISSDSKIDSGSLIDDQGTVNWNLVETLYNEGKKRGLVN